MDEEEKSEVQFSISLALPWQLRVPDGIFEGRHGRNHYALATKAASNRVGNSVPVQPTVLFRVMSGELTSAAGAHVPGAMLCYTEVTITFLKRVPHAAIETEDTERVIASAHKYLNHFLDCYRFVAKDTDVRPLNRREFHEVRAGRGLRVQSKVQRPDGTGTLMSGVYFDENDPIVLGSAGPIDAQALTELRQRLKEGHAPRLDRLLLLNAEAYLKSGETRLAVVDMNAALDVLVEQKAKIWLVQHAHSASAASEVLGKMNTTVIMRDILRPILHVPTPADFPWDEWYQKHRLLRNPVVHDAYEPTVPEAAESFENVSKLCEFLWAASITARRRLTAPGTAQIFEMPTDKEEFQWLYPEYTPPLGNINAIKVVVKQDGSLLVTADVPDSQEESSTR
jgi:hypothetical protein